MPADEEEGERAVELQPMLDAPVQPPLLLVSRGRQNSKSPLLPKDALSTMLHNLVLICTWCAMRNLSCTVRLDRPQYSTSASPHERTLKGGRHACLIRLQVTNFSSN